MTRYILLVATALLPFASLAQTKTKVKTKPTAPAAAAPAPTNTDFEGQLATEICQDFDKQNATKPFAQLSKDDAMSMLQQSMTVVMMRHPQEVEQLMQNSGDDASSAMREMGQRVAGKLAADCPIALVLFTRLSGSTTPVNAADMAISPAERPLLTTMTNEVCADLTARQASKSLAGESKEARTAILREAMQKSMKTHAREISDLYGPEIFMDQERIFSLGAKVGGLMAGQCAQSLTFFSQP